MRNKIATAYLQCACTRNGTKAVSLKAPTGSAVCRPIIVKARPIAYGVSSKKNHYCGQTYCTVFLTIVFFS